MCGWEAIIIVSKVFQLIKSNVINNIQHILYRLFNDWLSRLFLFTCFFSKNYFVLVYVSILVLSRGYTIIHNCTIYYLSIMEMEAVWKNFIRDLNCYYAINTIYHTICPGLWSHINGISKVSTILWNYTNSFFGTIFLNKRQFF